MTVEAIGIESSRERLRLMLVVARLYHVHGVRQREIGARLGISQARVSRVLRQAEAAGIVRTAVMLPEGLHPQLEDEIEREYGLQEALVVDIPSSATDLAATLGHVAAGYLAEATAGAEVVGFTSWSRTLQEMASAFPLLSRTSTRYVVEMLGDLGSPMVQHAAARATQVLADALAAEPVFLRTPGVAATEDLRDASLRDPHVRRALSLLDRLDIAFVGVGPPALHSHLESGEGYFTQTQLAQLRADGAVGQLNQRFFDEDGRRLPTPLDDLVVGSTLEQLARAHRRVVVAGGPDKQRSIAAALTGGWVDVLVTDVETARFLCRRPMAQVGGCPKGALVVE